MTTPLNGLANVGMDNDPEIKTCARCDSPTRYHHLCGRCAADELDDYDEDEGAEFQFECAGYYPEPAGEFYCPLWGTEECDWECPHGGLAP